MTTNLPPMLQSVRKFTDEPTVKVIDSSTDSERAAFETYLRNEFPESMYFHGDGSIMTSSNVLAGHTFLADTIKITDLIRANPVRLDAAAVSNGSWHFCYLYHPHIRTSTSVNVIIFPDQEYIVTNMGAANITVYVRRYDSSVGHNVDRPKTVYPGQTIRA